MKRTAKVLQLRQQIVAQIGELIDRDYVLLGLPYYPNVGDILIWEGERQFLGNSPYKCLNAGYRYRDCSRIGDKTLILLQGGGNFGDLWRGIHDERLEIVRRYRNNPILITPVTCWYNDTAALRQDALAFSQHQNVTICARDALSYGLLKQHFSNRILLVPDMAFCIDQTRLTQYCHTAPHGTLFLKRTDKELAQDSFVLPLAATTAEVRDWPTMEQDPPYWIRYRSLCNQAHAIGRFRGCWRFSQLVQSLSDWYYHSRCRKQLIRDGVQFVSRYSTIYTTRLHVGILSILLDKAVTILDNSYGKNSSFFETWLSGTEDVQIVKAQYSNLYHTRESQRHHLHL